MRRTVAAIALGTLATFSAAADAGPDPIICPYFQYLHNTDPSVGDPSHNGPEHRQDVYIDHEGDVFIDDDQDGTIQDDEMLWDCPEYVSDDDEDGRIDH